MLKLLTYDQVQEKLGIEKKKTLYDLINRGVFRKAIVRIPGMRPRLREDKLNELIEENTLPNLEV